MSHKHTVDCAIFCREPDVNRQTGVSNVRIVSVAIRHEDGRIWTLPAPARHHNLIHYLVETGVAKHIGPEFEQGFMDSLSRFCRRKPALVIATRANQLLPRATCNGGNLFSEDVW